MYLTIPGLTTRETALAIWLFALLAFSLTKADVRSSVGAFVKLFATSALLSGVILSGVAYAAATILLLRHVGYWQHGMGKVAIYWFVGIALVAMFRTKRTDAHYFTQFVLDNVALAAVIEFVVNFHTFPLPVEFVLVPVSVLLIGVEVVAAGSEEYAAARKPVTWILTLLGGSALIYSVVYIATHFGSVVTTTNAKEVVLPLVLSACFLPYLYALRLVVVWHGMLHMIKFGLRDDERLYRFARRLIIRACGLNLLRVQVFEERFRGRFWGVTTEEEVTQVVDDFAELWRRVRRQHSSSS